MASATSTPSTTAPLRWSAVRTDARTETCTTTTAVSEARIGAAMSVTSSAIHHDRPAARPDFATVPISVDVGGVHETASASRSHSRLAKVRLRLQDNAHGSIARDRVGVAMGDLPGVALATEDHRHPQR